MIRRWWIFLSMMRLSRRQEFQALIRSIRQERLFRSWILPISSCQHDSRWSLWQERMGSLQPAGSCILYSKKSFLAKKVCTFLGILIFLFPQRFEKFSRKKKNAELSWSKFRVLWVMRSENPHWLQHFHQIIRFLRILNLIIRTGTLISRNTSTRRWISCSIRKNEPFWMFRYNIGLMILDLHFWCRQMFDGFRMRLIHHFEIEQTGKILLFLVVENIGFQKRILSAIIMRWISSPVRSSRMRCGYVLRG